ncbi:MAG: hypothetical protein SFV32_11800 [Opitutaceae bacterium]|nr:hypothetical protein [Opitutaceae bacterium]
MKVSNILSLMGAAALAATTSAFGLSYNANTDGLTAPAGVTMTGYSGAMVRDLGLKTENNWTTIGVKGGAAANEIGIGERLEVVFANPMHVTSLTLGLLFNGDEYNDWQEIAVATLLGTLTEYTLTALTNTDATWSGGAPATNLDAAISGKAAVWQIQNPFGNMAINGFVLTPRNNPQAPRGRNGSDFGLQAFTTASVRVADMTSTWALASLSVAGLLALKRRR